LGTRSKTKNECVQVNFLRYEFNSTVQDVLKMTSVTLFHIS